MSGGSSLCVSKLSKIKTEITSKRVNRQKPKFLLLLFPQGQHECHEGKTSVLTFMSPVPGTAPATGKTLNIYLLNAHTTPTNTVAVTDVSEKEESVLD